MKRKLISSALVLLILSSLLYAQKGTVYYGARMLIEKTGAISLTPKSGQAVTVTGPLTVTGATTLNSTLSTSGQATFTRDPASTSASAASVYINPATSASNEPLLAVADNGTERFKVDKEGDISSKGVALTSTFTELNQLAGVKRYVARITQAGTDAPTATVIENSFGAPLVLDRTGLGTYTVTLAGAFPATKWHAPTFVVVSDDTIKGCTFDRVSDNALSITCLNGAAEAVEMGATDASIVIRSGP